MTKTEIVRNLPGIRYPGSVPGSPNFELPGSCFGSCFQPFSIFLVTPGSRGLIPGKDQEVTGKDRKFLVKTRKFLVLQELLASNFGILKLSP